MKRFYHILCLSVITMFSIFVTSCQKETMLLTSNPNAIVSTTVIGMHDAMTAVDSVVSVSANLDEELSRGTSMEQLEATRQKEAEIAAALMPLTNSGEQLRTNLLIAANDPDSGFFLSTEEIRVLENLNDAELAQMMLVVLSAADDDVIFTDDPGRKISTGKAKDCLWEALGINDMLAILDYIKVGCVAEIVHIFVSLPKGKLFNLLAKITGKANYIMLAYAAANFVYCLLSEDAYMVKLPNCQNYAGVEKAGIAEIFEADILSCPAVIQITNE